MARTLHRMILSEVMQVRKRYHLGGEALLRTAPIYLIYCENSMQDLGFEMGRIRRELQAREIFGPSSDVLQLFSCYRPNEQGGMDLGFQTREGQYLPGYEQWMVYLSGKLQLDNAVVALHVRKEDPEMITPQGWKNLWRVIRSYGAHTLTLVIVDPSTKDKVISSFRGEYFYRLISYNPMSAEDKVEYFLSGLASFDVQVDAQRVRECMLPMVKKSKVCGQKEISLLVQSIVWDLAVRETDRQMVNTKESEGIDTELVLEYLQSEQARHFFEEHGERRVIGFR